MSSRARTLVLVFVATLFAALATGRDYLFSLAYLWAGLLGLAFVWSWSSLRGLELVRTPRGPRAQVGRVFEERLWLRNRSRWPKLWVEIHDESELPGHRASSVKLSVGRNEERFWIVRTSCRRRGRFRIGPARLVAGDPFGLFPRTRPAAASYPLVVLPMTAPIPSFVFPSGRLSGGEALRRRTHQVTTNAAGVRDYLPGDAFHRIHWPSTVRRERLIVKEFELDPLADVWIVLDANRHAQAGQLEAPALPAERGRLVPDQFELPPSTFEYAVAAAASLSSHFLQRDRAVGILALGRSRLAILPQRGDSQLFRLLETLAVVEADGEVAFQDMLRMEGPAIPKGSTVVLITSADDEAIVDSMRQLRRSGLYPVMIHVARPSFGGPGGGWDLADAARRLSLPGYSLRRGDRLEAALWERAPRPRWAA